MNVKWYISDDFIICITPIYSDFDICNNLLKEIFKPGAEIPARFVILWSINADSIRSCLGQVFFCHFGPGGFQRI